MKQKEFILHAHEMVDWLGTYLENIKNYPVKSTARPGSTKVQLPENPPENGENFASIFSDFQNIILPGITHWQHPAFFAYFPANNSYPSILAEMLTAALGAQCMSWQTSPAATELEERVLEWLRQMIGLPADFSGVIQDTASTATLCSLLTAREKLNNFAINENGFPKNRNFTVYCSSEAHSSIEKAVKIAGIGKNNLRKIEVDNEFALNPMALEMAITADINKGFQPLCVVAAIGTTGSVAIDPLEAIGIICKKYGIWLHVDAAYAGTALLLPELRWMIKGIEMADTFVFNPHKWMFTNFDCSAYFVRDKETLIRTFEILPEYLKTTDGARVNNYRDWGIQLGRRFRALKLWFVIRDFGVRGLQEKIRNHLAWTQELAKIIRFSGDFELLAPVFLSTICFRYKPAGVHAPEALNDLNSLLLENINNSGRLYMSHTRLNGVFTLRLVIAQTTVDWSVVAGAWQIIIETARSLKH
jgi:aromatic-L-amino-acid decarboxylase